MTKIIPIILSGGVGSRLWPLSREEHPKPFIRFNGNQSFIQDTLSRAMMLPNIEEIVTVTHRDLYFYARDEYEEVKGRNVPLSFILEPCRRSSAPAIAAAAHYVAKKHGEDAILLTLPADHLIQDTDAFLSAIERASQFATAGKLVTFGIHPKSPNTGYGYIKVCGSKALEFVEKPNLELAQSYVASKEYLWNSGMFCFTAKTIFDEMRQHSPLIANQTKCAIDNAYRSNSGDWMYLELKSEDFEKIESTSIDCALFEKSQNIAVVATDMDWSDIGTWAEFGKTKPQDNAGNHIFGETVLEDVRDCIIHSKDRMVAGFGLNNLIIADTSDALLIADRDQAQDLKRMVKKLTKQNHKSYKKFPTVFRPWGSFTILQESENFKIKRIEVKPGARLSLQSHKFRSEHWVVVQGNAEVENDGNSIRLKVNQSTHIPIGSKHRLANIDNEHLIMIEVQCGSYLGEDDITRFDDIYGRLGDRIGSNQ